MKLVNNRTNQIEEVENYEDSLYDGSHGLVAGEDYKLFNRDSEIVSVGAAEASQMFKDGMSFATEEDQYSEERSKVEDSSIEQLKVAGEGIAEGLTFGTSTGLMKKFGVIDPDAYKLRHDVYPTTGLVGDIAGSIVSGFGVGAIASGAARATARVGGKAAEYALAGAIESGVRGLGDYYSETELYDEEWTAENAISRASLPAIIGGVFGGTVGKIASRGTKKTTKKTLKDVLAKNGAITEEDNLFKNLDIDSLLVTKKDKELGIDGIHVITDPEGNNFVKSGRSDILIKPEQMDSLKILDMHDKASLDELGNRVGVEDLYNRIDKTYGSIKNATGEGAFTIRDLLANFKAKEVENALSEELMTFNLLKKSEYNEIKNITKKRDIIRSRIRKGYNAKEARAKLNKLDYIYDQKLKKISKIKKYDGTSPVDELYAARRKASLELDEIFDLYDGYRTSEKTIVKPSSLSGKFEAIIDGTAKTIGESKQSTNHILSAVGFNKAMFKKFGDIKRDEIADMVYSLRGKQDKGMIKKMIGGNKTPLNSKFIDENLSKMMDNSYFGIDNAITKMENLIPSNRLNLSRLSGKKVSNLIKRSADKRMRNSLGNVEAIYKNEYKQLIDLADNIRIERIDSSGVDQPFTLHEFRNFKTKLGRLSGFDRADSIKRDILQDIYVELNSHVERLAKSNGLMSIHKELVDNNRNVHIGMIIQDALVNKIKGTQNSVEAITDIASGMLTTGAMLSMGAVPGFMLGKFARVSRKFMSDNGDEIMGEYFKAIEKSNMATQKVIKKSSEGFVKNFSKRISSSSFTSNILREDIEKVYENDKRQLEEIKSNPAIVLDSFLDNNQKMSALAPEAARIMFEKANSAVMFLNEKMPVSNNDDGFDSDYIPPEREIRKYHRYRNAVMFPMKIIKNAEEGYISQEAKEVLKTIYPALYRSFINGLSISVSGSKVSKTQKRKILNFIGATQSKFSVNNNRRVIGSLKESGSQEEQEKVQTSNVKAPTESMQKKRYNNQLTQSQRIQER